MQKSISEYWGDCSSRSSQDSLAKHWAIGLNCMAEDRARGGSPTEPSAPEDTGKQLPSIKALGYQVSVLKEMCTVMR